MLFMGFSRPSTSRLLAKMSLLAACRQTQESQAQQQQCGASLANPQALTALGCHNNAIAGCGKQNL
jgi:hypothetical protein